jgi:hypothetical protein
LRISRCPIETFGLVGALEEIQKVRLQGEPLQVFLVIRYRGEETITTEGLIVRDELKVLYPLVETHNYVPIDPEVAPFWKRILGKEPNPYLVEMYHFRVAGPPAAPTAVNLETEHAAQTEP